MLLPGLHGTPRPPGHKASKPAPKQTSSLSDGTESLQDALVACAFLCKWTDVQPPGRVATGHAGSRVETFFFFSNSL